MDLRKEVFSHQEKLWIICLSNDSGSKPLSALFDMIDWYNNQLITKNLLAEKLDLSFGSKTIIATTGILSVNKILVFGLGSANQKVDSKTFLQLLNETLEGLEEKDPWIIVPSNFSDEITHQLHSQRSQLKSLTGATVSASQ